MGCGMMASALMEGLVNKKVVNDPSSITCSDIYPPSVEKAVMKSYSATKLNDEVCDNENDVIIIAVKPNVVEDIYMNISKFNSNPLTISIAAGISLETLQKDLPGRRMCEPSDA